MGSFSIAHWAIVAIVVLLLFGPGRIAQSMGDFGKGIAAFKKGLAEDTPSSEPMEKIVSAPSDRSTD